MYLDFLVEVSPEFFRPTDEVPCWVILPKRRKSLDGIPEKQVLMNW
jgi:hypothetical protein